MAKFSSSLKIDKLVDQNKKIGVLCGGMSKERDVSIRSGKNCYEALLRLGYKAELIDVDKNIAYTLKEKSIDVAFIILHGKYGEDGCIQGLLKILDIPFTGSGVEANAISINKERTKQILNNYNIPLIRSITVNNLKNIDNINLTYPVMVKPVSEGSSIGMSKVEMPAELSDAVKIALECDSTVMIEEYIQGKSITVGVLDNKSDTFATSVLEFRTKTEWYDFEAKYTEGMTEFILPAKISKELTELVQEISIKTHNAVGAVGMSRVDFLIDEKNRPFVLEINTIPGMTDLSDLPAQSNDLGIDYDSLVQIILNSAMIVDK